MGFECIELPTGHNHILDRWTPDYLQDWYDGTIDDPKLGRYQQVFKSQQGPPNPEPPNPGSQK